MAGVRFKARLNVLTLGMKKSTATGSAGAATLNAPSGVVTTESLTTAAGATFTETIANSEVAAADVCLASVTTAGNGAPVVVKTTPAAGSLVVTVQNVHASAAFNNALKIAFACFK
jgi:hypothetical protein